jgi:hypothetical protein
MFDRRRFERISLVVALLAASWLAGSALRAEVGAAGTDTISSYVVKGIVDDTEPQGSVWKRYNADGPSRAVLNEDGLSRGDGEPSLLTTAAGVPLVAWARNSASGFDIVVSRFVGGAWSVPLAVASSPAAELDPFLALDPANGSVQLLYWIHDGAPRVMRVKAPADLSSWTVPEQVSGPGEIACRPAGVFHQGAFHAIYEVHDMGYGAAPRRIVIATEGPVGFTGQTFSQSWHAPFNWPQLHSGGGRLWVEWIDGPSEMIWTHQLAPGGWSPVQSEPFGTTESRDFQVRGTIRHLVLQ